jgi:hypothetical protein
VRDVRRHRGREGRGTENSVTLLFSLFIFRAELQ